MKRLIAMMLGLLAAPLVCADEVSTPVITASGSAVYGEAMPLGKPLAVGSAIDQADQWLARPGKFEGRITSVCQNRGCWLVLADGERHARVFSGHSFFLPKDTTGTAVVHGRLSQRTLNEGFARHLAEDAGQDPAAISGEQVEYRIDAVSVEILPGS
ncbi:MAG: DUF4920 domain-containing protein [Xanthomonadales bacterium]|nr:DUF4920 domain-containing protein [Xanthomonadales bacterium]